MLDSYPTGSGNHESFWAVGSEVSFPDRGKASGGRGGICDRVEGQVCLCDAGPPVFGVNGGGWAHNTPLYSFSDGNGGPNECYGDQKDVPFGRTDRVCALERLAIELCSPNPTVDCLYPRHFAYPFAPPLSYPMYSWDGAINNGLVIARSLDVEPGSRHSILTKSALGFGITTQFFSPTFVPFWSALPPGAPFSGTNQNGFQGVHGVGFDNNIDWMIDRLEEHNQPAAQFAMVARPVDLATGASPVEVSFPQDLSFGRTTTLQIKADGPAPPPMYVAPASGVYYNIDSTVDAAATVLNPIQVCIDYGDLHVMDPHRLGLFHFSGGSWSDITSFRDPVESRICGNTTSLSPFALFEPMNLAPIAMAGAPIQVEALGPAGASVRVTAAGSHDPDLDDVEYRWLDGGGGELARDAVVELHLPIGVHLLALRVTDSRGGLATAPKRVEVVDTTAPNVSLSVVPQGGTYRLAGEAFDAVGVTRVRFEVDGAPVGEAQSAPYTLAWSASEVADGWHEIRAFAEDVAGNVGRSSVVVILLDRTAPSLHVSASPSVIWSPNGKLIEVTVVGQVNDALDPSPRVFLESVSCDDGCAPAADIVGASLGTYDRAFFVRARRTGSGLGRTYRVTYRAEDSSGNFSRQVVTIVVPHDRKGQP